MNAIPDCLKKSPILECLDPLFSVKREISMLKGLEFNQGCNNVGENKSCAVSCEEVDELITHSGCWMRCNMLVGDKEPTETCDYNRDSEHISAGAVSKKAKAS